MLRHEDRLGGMLNKICPEGIERLKMKLVERYKEQGFEVEWTDSFEIV